MCKKLFLSDKEVASVLEVSVKTLYRMLRGFHQKSERVRGGRKLDLRKMEPDVVNGVRRWRVSRVASVLDITPDEIEQRIS